MAFQLFRLPILVIKLVLETMGFIEIFVLTSTSLKTKQICRNLVTIRNHELELFLRKTGIWFNFKKQADLYPKGAIFLLPKENQPDHDVFLMRIGSSEHVPAKIYILNSTILLKIFWDPSTSTGTEVYNAIFEMFRVPVDELCMNMDNVEFATIESWIDWNNDLFHDSRLFIGGKCSFSNYVWILKNVKTRHALYFGVEPTEYPNNPETIEFINIGAAHISIFHGRWINTQMLNSLKANEISIWRVTFTDSEINAFLRIWRASEVSSNWKKLKILFNRQADPGIVFEEMNATDEDLLKPENALRQWGFNLNNGEKCTTTYAFYRDEDHNGYYGLEFCVGS